MPIGLPGGIGGGGAKKIGWVDEVDNFAALPSATGSGDVYLVKASTGFLWNRRKGLYRDDGVDTWNRFSNVTLEVMDSELTISDSADTTKKLDLELSSITTSTERTLTVQDADGTIPLLEGIAGGQTLNGGVNPEDDLVLNSTSHANKGCIELRGDIICNPDFEDYDVYIGAYGAGYGYVFHFDAATRETRIGYKLVVSNNTQLQNLNGYGHTDFNVSYGDKNFYIRKLSSGFSFVFDAGRDELTLGSDTELTANVFMSGLKSGATKATSGAGTDELWVTVSHATLPDGVVMRG